jgi:hypothetical protein
MDIIYKAYFYNDKVNRIKYIYLKQVNEMYNYLCIPTYFMEYMQSYSVPESLNKIALIIDIDLKELAEQGIKHRSDSINKDYQPLSFNELICLYQNYSVYAGSLYKNGTLISTMYNPFFFYKDKEKLLLHF